MLRTQDQTNVQRKVTHGYPRMRAVYLSQEDWARLLQASDLGFDEAHQERDDRILDALRRALRP